MQNKRGKSKRPYAPLLLSSDRH